MTSREKRQARKAWRERKRRQKQKQNLMECLTPPSTPTTSPSFEGRQESRKAAGRKRVRKDRSAVYRQVEKLKVKLQTKTREAERYKKRFQRKQMKTNDNNSPRTKTKLILRGQKAQSSTRRTLLLHNVIIRGLREKYRAARANYAKQLLDKTFNKSLLKKYRLKSMAANELGINTKRFDREHSRGEFIRKRESIIAKLKKSVENFLCRDDNTRVKAGKRSTKTFKKNKQQARLLNDSLKTLHAKFLVETTSKMSYSLFCRLKPFYIRIPKPSDRETFQCKRHENFKFKAEKLKQLSVLATSDLHQISNLIVCSTRQKDCMYRDCNVCKEKKVPIQDFEEGKMTEWYEWKTKRFPRTSDVDKETKMVTMTVKEKEKGAIGNLVNDFQQEMDKCCKHLFNIQNQYESIKKLKEKLTQKDLICHVDFSENYSCKYNEEIQSIHFGASQRQVSLHTGVLYAKDAMESFCSLSDNLKHAPVGIWAHLRPVLKWAKDKFPEIQNLYFVSDGPTTQYRCKDNFYMLSTLPFEEGFKSVNWSFMEAGHGKGAPDGIGAVIKRAADTAVLHRQDITDAESMYSVLTQKGISPHLFLISNDQFDDEENKSPRDIQSVSGTMKIHQIFTREPCQFSFRDVSCFCEFPGDCDCFTPKHHKFPVNEQRENEGDASDIVTSVENEPALDSPGFIQKHDHFDEAMKGTFCVVTYDGKPYPGIVQDVDDTEIEVNVMHCIGPNRFFWPRMQDVLWYSSDQFVTQIPPPSKIGSRHQQIDPTIWEIITKALDL